MPSHDFFLMIQVKIIEIRFVPECNRLHDDLWIHPTSRLLLEHQHLSDLNDILIETGLESFERCFIVS